MFGFIVGSQTIRTTTTITNMTASSLSKASGEYCFIYNQQVVQCASRETFALSINCSGAWTVKYEGYNTIYRSNYNNLTETSSGSYSGSGQYAQNITVSGPDNGWSLCAQAQKGDASSSPLILRVSGQENETSLPFGATSVCSGWILV
jgi:hypothetical protein